MDWAVRVAVVATLVATACTPVPQDVELPAWAGPRAEEESTPYEDDVPLTDPEGACGETHIVDMTLTGYVLDEDWQPVSDRLVWVEERDWTPLNRHGEARTDDDGRYVLHLTGLPIVEGCWGVGPQFYVVANHDNTFCEVPANMQLVMAWLDETLEADISGYPCVLEPPAG